MARCLSFHATYRCEHSGACCTAQWPIPIEADRLARLRAAVASGQVAPAERTGPHGRWLAGPPPEAADAGGVLAVAHGRCVFLASEPHYQCRIQAALGHGALPLACRQFPRVSVVDPRGASVTLSAYCPTAARMLDRPGPVSIVEHPAAFPETGEYVGFDARAGWPPILRPGVLMDWPAWWAFEARAVDLVGNVAVDASDALSRASAAVDAVRGWTVENGPLLSFVERVFDDVAGDGRPRPTKSAAYWSARAEAVHHTIPTELMPPPVAEPTTREPPGRARAFLAAHAFANWAIHLGEDLRAWLDSLEAAYALLHAGCSVREADLRLRHLCPVGGPARRP